VRNETILSSRGREGRCKRVGVVFSPLRRLTSLRRGEGGSEPGADFGRALSRWGPRERRRERERERETLSLRESRGRKGTVKLTKMTRHLLIVRSPSLVSLYFLFPPILASRALRPKTFSLRKLKATLGYLNARIKINRGAQRSRIDMYECDVKSGRSGRTSSMRKRGRNLIKRSVSYTPRPRSHS